jgi:hypothetical protein
LEFEAGGFTAPGSFCLGVHLIDLILKDVQDEYAQENFFRLKTFIDAQVLFEGNFKLFDLTIPKKISDFKVLHGLTFIPSDIIPLSASGDLNYYWTFQKFDNQYMFITTNGPVRIRFLAGKLKDRVGGASNNVAPFDFVAPGDVVRPASPGFVFGAVGDKTPGFWLTSEGIPSNVVGIPVLFSDASVVQAAVGTEIEASYKIGIYQHEGEGVGLTKIGEFDIAANGAKRVALDIPVIASTNTQLACRLENGNTTNLKVSLVLKGSAI